jgi:hypothetical protein
VNGAACSVKGRDEQNWAEKSRPESVGEQSGEGENAVSGERKKERKAGAREREKKGFGEDTLGRAGEVKDWNLWAPLSQRPEALACCYGMVIGCKFTLGCRGEVVW